MFHNVEVLPLALPSNQMKTRRQVFPQSIPSFWVTANIPTICFQISRPCWLHQVGRRSGTGKVERYEEKETEIRILWSLVNTTDYIYIGWSAVHSFNLAQIWRPQKTRDAFHNPVASRKRQWLLQKITLDIYSDDLRISCVLYAICYASCIDAVRNRWTK